MNLMASIILSFLIGIIISVCGCNAAMEHIISDDAAVVVFERMEQDDVQLDYYQSEKSWVELNQTDHFHYEKIVQGLRSGSGKVNGSRDIGQSLVQVCLGSPIQKPFLNTSGSFNLTCIGSSAREMIVNDTIAVLTNGAKLTYCLVDHLGDKNCSSYLTFGNITKFKTELQSQILKAPSHYAAHLVNMTIGGKDSGVKNGVSVFDSSSTVTTLPHQVYDEVVNKLKEFLDGKYRKTRPIAPFQFCYMAAGFDENSLPKIVVYFDGKRFEPPLKSYIVDVQPQVKCIALRRGQNAEIFVIGSMMQENHIWEFTLFNKILGFDASARLLFFSLF